MREAALCLNSFFSIFASQDGKCLTSVVFTLTLTSCFSGNQGLKYLKCNKIPNQMHTVMECSSGMQVWRQWFCQTGSFQDEQAHADVCMSHNKHNHQPPGQRLEVYLKFGAQDVEKTISSRQKQKMHQTDQQLQNLCSCRIYAAAEFMLNLLLRHKRVIFHLIVITYAYTRFIQFSLFSSMIYLCDTQPKKKIS